MNSTNDELTLDLALDAPLMDGFDAILTPEAQSFVAGLQRQFNERREALLAKREVRQQVLDGGELPALLAETREIRESAWSVAPALPDLQKRHVEITGPVERKMMINALNSGADVFMADFEDSLSPTWENVVQGQLNLRDAVRRAIRYENPANGKVYELNDDVATLLVRPRGWHLVEKHALVDGLPVSASLFDFGLYVFHNGRALLERGSGPYFYLAKLENHEEARLWNEVFVAAQAALGIPQGSIRATVLIENILAAFEMEEILFELREHAAGLNAGRWDYIFSIIKKFREREDFMLPDRGQITMTVPFMRAYTERLVRACHKRGAHAIGGMSAFIPNRREPEVTERALAAVRADKERESGDGCDGTWVAHPDLVPVVKEIFDEQLGDRPHQKERLREQVDEQYAPDDLVDIRVPGGEITEAGVRLNVSVALQYLNSWFAGNGAAAINNLMEDAATAEISRSQLWQWRRHGARLGPESSKDGQPMTDKLYRQIRDEELEKLGGRGEQQYEKATAILDELVLGDEFIGFLTLPAYEMM